MKDRLKFLLVLALFAVPMGLLIWRPDTFGAILQQQLTYPRNVAWLLALDGIVAIYLYRLRVRNPIVVMILGLSLATTFLHAWIGAERTAALAFSIPLIANMIVSVVLVQRKGSATPNNRIERTHER